MRDTKENREEKRLFHVTHDRPSEGETVTHSLGTLSRGWHLMEGILYLIFPKWWPGIIFLKIHHMRVDNNMSFLST